MIDALVPAAGKGKRFKGRKQFYKIGGKPILIFTLQLLQLVDEIQRIILVVPPTRRERIKKMLKSFHIARVKAVVGGGKRRIDSVRMGMRFIRSRKMIIHDAVRPVASYKLFERVINELKSYPAVIPVIPIRDTVKQVKRGYTLKTVPRKGLFLSQTPQGFETRILRSGLKDAGDDDYTDEAAVLEAAGIKVKTVAGEIMNIKITKKSDIDILKEIL